MSSDRVPIARAQRVAAELVEALEGTCDKIEIVGSLRGATADTTHVGDIEILCIPSWGTKTEARGSQRDMFADRREVSVNLLWEQVDYLVATGAIQQEPDPARRKWGAKYRTCRMDGIHVDIFTADARAWGSQMIIRTGPWEYSRRFVTELRRYGYRHDGGLVRRSDGEVVDVPTEGDAYALVKTAWRAPEERR